VKRAVLALILALTVAAPRTERILLVPLDSRPAAGQFAQMIGKMANVEVRLPPYESLGRFTQPGNPDAIIEWLKNQDYSDVSSVVVSTDMIAYGGLIASRVNDVPEEEAQARLAELADLRKRLPNVRFYGFSSIMRLNPTATRATAAWRLQLGRYAEVKDRFRRTNDPKLKQTLRNLEAKIPPIEIQRYDQTRARNMKVQNALLRMTQAGLFDYLVFGQDDAQPFGPHISETRTLRATADRLNVQGRTYFCEGIDQLGNVLLSRALLRSRDWTPRIRVVYSDDEGRKRVADYESKPIEQSLRDQILASGARPAAPNQEYDYTLYVNVPQRRDETFQPFLESLTSEIDQGFPVSVADINLAKDGTSDPVLFEAMNQNSRSVRLLSYAGWNTAGNTLGTSIPAANIYLLARRSQDDPLRRELALREFLLHRFVNDYEYHKFVRPQAYRLIDSTPSASREETYGEAFNDVNGYVQKELDNYLQETFKAQVLGQKFFAGPKQYEISGIEGVKIFLPWPRAYEVRMEFSLTAREVSN
jgi:hypothetical protein